MAMYRELYPIPAWINLRRALAFSVIGRLKPGVSRERAGAEMQSLAQELARQFPKDNQGRNPKIIPIEEAAINHGTRNTIANSGLLLMIVAALTLLIACANVANLLLARAAGRNKEIAVRMALGASRGRLIRQLLTESVVLSLAGGAVGLLLARWASSVMWAVRPPALTTAVFHVGLDARVLGFTFAIAVLTGVLFGLAPALRATNPDLATDLKERAGQAASGLGGRRPRSVLVACEVALCVVALIGAGLFIRSLSNAEQIDPGFDTDHLGMVSFNVGDRSYSEDRGREFQKRALERTASLPGVAAVALARDRLFRVTFSRNVLIGGDAQVIDGRPTLVSPVSPNYFRTTGIALVRGRDFNALDTQDKPRVAIVNEAAAARFWPNQDPIGKTLNFSGDTAAVQVIGVARTVSYLAVAEPPQALIYTSLLQDYAGAATLIYRTSGRPEPVLASVLHEVQALDTNLLLQSLTVRAALSNSLWAPRLSAGLLSVFGILGLVLATLGVYGVVSYSVNQRVREIGVRMAMGATGGDVQVLILRQGLAVVTVGVVAGLFIALGASRAVESLLIVTSARDALTFVLVPSILILAAIVACWLPARRATRIDPALALRNE
jgi:predicted permease